MNIYVRNVWHLNFFDFSFYFILPFVKNLFCIFLQKEVVETAGQEVFTLGLLIGCEDFLQREEDPVSFQFHHQMFQVFVGAKYIAQLPKVIRCFILECS